jgi:hypothetical protein
MGARNDDTLSISHHLFADDTLIFCGIALDNPWHFQCVLLCFEAVLGLKINSAKSELVLVGDVPNVNASVHILGCTVSFLPLKYLLGLLSRQIYLPYNY